MPSVKMRFRRNASRSLSGMTNFAATRLSKEARSWHNPTNPAPGGNDKPVQRETRGR